LGGMEQSQQDKPARKPSVRKPSENTPEPSALASGSKPLGSIKTETPASGRLASVNDDTKKTRGGASKVRYKIMYNFTRSSV